MRYVLPIIMLILALVLVIFGAQNTQAVNVRFLGAETGMISLALVIVVAAIFGAAAGRRVQRLVSHPLWHSELAR